MTAKNRTVTRYFTEKQFASQLEDLLNLYGWLWFHPWRSDHSVAGFPDYVAIRGDRIIWLEIKGYGGKRKPGQPSGDQSEWLCALEAAGADWRLCWPEDWDELQEWLR